MKYFSSYLIALVLVLTIGCAYNPYRSTNRAHKKQVKSLSKLIRQYPLRPIQSDSIQRSAYFCRHYQSESAQTKFCDHTSYSAKQLSANTPHVHTSTYPGKRTLRDLQGRDGVPDAERLSQSMARRCGQMG